MRGEILDDISLFLKAARKEEIGYLIKHFNIPVGGFQRNIDRAPEGKLISAIKQELRDSLNPKARGRKRTSLTEFYEKISSECIQKYSEIKEFSLNELGLQMDVYPFSNLTSLSLLYMLFPSVYENNKHLLYNNVFEEKFLLEGIAERMPLEERIKQLEELISPWKSTKETMEEYWRNTADSTLSGHRKKAIVQGEQVLLESNLLPEEKKHLPILAFLLEKERFKESKYVPFLLYVLMCIRYQENMEYVQRIGTLKNENSNYFQEMENLKKDLKTNKLENMKIKEMNLKIKNELKKLQEENNNLWKVNEKYEPLRNYFNELMSKYNIIVFSRNTIKWENSIFREHVLSVEVLEEASIKGFHLNLLNKIIFVERIAFNSTKEWLNVIQFLFNNDIENYEIVGYEIEDYIKQVFQHLEKKER